MNLRLKIEPLSCACAKDFVLLAQAFMRLKTVLSVTRVRAKRTTTDPNVYDTRIWLADGRLWRATLTLDVEGNPLVQLGQGSNDFRGQEHGHIRTFRQTFTNLILDNQPAIELIDARYNEGDE